MKHYLFHLLLLELLLLQLVNCSKPDTPQANNNDQIKQEVAVPQPSDETGDEPGQVEEEQVPSADELPIAEDFSDEYEEKINDKNYKVELQALEKEISKDDDEVP